MNSIGIVIRTYNEEKYLGKLLSSINKQNYPKDLIKIFIVDSGSDDSTLSIAKKFNTKIIPIKKEDFSFGRSLNYGCKQSNTDIIVFISGHCIPTSKNWLSNLTNHFKNNIKYVYGRQIGGTESFFSEKQIFNKYFKEKSTIPQKSNYCNNANSAILASTWKKFKFDEDLTGLEDMYLSKKIQESGCEIAYIANACVFHLHAESWSQICKRFEREAFALRKIYPELKINVKDFLLMTLNSIIFDILGAFKRKILIKNFKAIIFYRVCQFYGSFKGNQPHKRYSKKLKKQFFYPDRKIL
jgi:rhamnosyltransferase